MDKIEKVELTNMCMIYDDEGKILVQNRVKKDWAGITFPGGHVEKGESFVKSVIREVYEETGLEIENPLICGIKQFQVSDDTRYIVVFFKTNKFKGELRKSEEGEVFWIRKDELKNYQLSNDFDQMFEVFDSENLSEFFYTKDFGVKLY